jgi:hypothetical protein
MTVWKLTRWAAVLALGLAVTGASGGGGAAMVRAQEAAPTPGWSVSLISPADGVLLPQADEPTGRIMIQVDPDEAYRFARVWVEQEALANGERLPMVEGTLEKGIRTYSYRLDPCKVPGGSDQPGTRFTLTYRVQLNDFEAEEEDASLGERTGSAEVVLGPGAWCTQR